MLGTALYSGQAAANLIDCAQIENRWRNATADTSFDEWVRLYDDAHYESDCGSPVVAGIGLDIIERELPAIRSAYRSSLDSGTFGALRDRVDALLEFGGHWEVWFLLGEAARKQKDVRGAMSAYREALKFVDDEELTPTPPHPDDIRLLRDRLDETALVVAQIAPSDLKITTRVHGRPISQYASTSRGYKRKKALVPILFVFDRAELTEEGRGIFDDVLETLEKQGSPDITVVGHTDTSGTNEYNMGLSKRRAAAVRSKLVARGYTGRVTTRGMGEEQPFVFDDPGLYDDRTKDQANRRVEIVFGGS